MVERWERTALRLKPLIHNLIRVSISAGDARQGNCRHRSPLFYYRNFAFCAVPLHCAICSPSRYHQNRYYDSALRCDANTDLQCGKTRGRGVRSTGAVYLERLWVLRRIYLQITLNGEVGAGSIVLRSCAVCIPAPIQRSVSCRFRRRLRLILHSGQ